MTNLISRSYEGLDGALMKGANATVRAWNWTTGRTKSDLANMANITGLAAIIGGLAIGMPLLLPLTLPISLLMHLTNKENTRTDSLELEAREKNCLNMGVEKLKRQYKIMGPIVIGTSGALGASCYALSNSLNEEIFSASLTIGTSVIGVSTYIMRVDSPPPRKNCLRRGLDRLSEIAKEYRPTLQPIPA